jgi:hypothetical protein
MASLGACERSITANGTRIRPYRVGTESVRGPAHPTYAVTLIPPGTSTGLFTLP